MNLNNRKPCDIVAAILGPRRQITRSAGLLPAASIVLVAALAIALSSCTGGTSAKANEPNSVTVGVTSVVKKTLSRQLTLSSELVPFQEIDVYAKESGYVEQTGRRLRNAREGWSGDSPSLRFPSYKRNCQGRPAEIKNANNQVSRARHEFEALSRPNTTLSICNTRASTRSSKSQPGIVAQQEVDDAQGKDLAAASQVDAGQSALEAAQSQLGVTKAKLVHDQSLYDYSRITAPFAGVITQRYANLGTLVQGGTNSSTQAMPIVRLSEDDLFRLVIPVPEAYVRYIRIGDPVDVRVPSLNRSFPGKVIRFSVDVRAGYAHHAHRSRCAESGSPVNARTLRRSRCLSRTARRYPKRAASGHQS